MSQRTFASSVIGVPGVPNVPDPEPKGTNLSLSERDE